MNRLKPMQNYSGDSCGSCIWRINDGVFTTQKEVEQHHSNCHDWVHCGNECCGECEVCGE